MPEITSETARVVQSTKDCVREYLENLKQQLRDRNIPYVQKWKPVAKHRLLIGRMLVTPTERFGEPGAAQERKVYIDLEHAEWQVRQSINDGVKSMLMVPLIIEEGNA